MPLRVTADIHGIFAMWPACCYMFYLYYLNNSNLNRISYWVVVSLWLPQEQVLLPSFYWWRNKGPGNLLWTERVPEKYICGSPNSRCDGVRRWGFWGVIRFRWSHEGKLSWWDSCSYKMRKRQEGCLTFSPQVPWGKVTWAETEKGLQAWSTSQEEGAHQKLKPLAPWSRVFQPLELRKINGRGLSHQSVVLYSGFPSQPKRT